MPTATFSSADATLIDQIISGNLIVSQNPAPPDSYTISSLTTGVGIGVFNFLASTLTGEWVSPFGQIATSTPVIQQIYDMDFTDIVTGLPDGAKIKKMIINAPCSCNYDLSTGPGIDVGGGAFGCLFDGMLRCIAGLTFTVNAVAHTLNIAGETVTDPDAPATAIGVRIDDSVTLVGSSANVTILDLTAGPTFVTKEDFITNYSRIKMNAGITITGTNTWPDQAGPATIISLVVYSLTASVGWSVSVEYEYSPITWEVASPPSPPADRAIQPGDTIELTSDPEADNPLDFTQIETLEIELLDAEDNVVGTVDIPESYWTVIEFYLFTFTMPEFNDPFLNIQRVKFKITGTQFSGSMELQTSWVIYFYNAPGVYTLVDGRAHDTYYDRITDPEVTAEINTKIPNPTGRTGLY